MFSHLLFSLFPYLANNSVPDSHIPQAFAWETIALLPVFSVFYNGSFAVSIFFVLSGYVLTKKFFETRDTRVLVSGAIKRYPRLVIPAALSVMFAWVLLSLGAMNNHLIPILGSAGWPYGQYEQTVTLFEAVKAGFIGGPIFGDTALNSPLWTIRIELLGSLFLFAAYAITGTNRLARTFICFLVMAVVANWESINIVHFVAIFAGSVLNRVIIPVKLSAYFIATGLLCGGFDYSAFYAWVPSLWGHEKLVMNTIGAIFLVTGTLANRAFSRLLESKVPVYLGKISFSSYLLHWPIICSFSFGMIYVLKFDVGLDHQSAALVVLAMTIVLVIILSTLFARFVDIPAMVLASNFAKLRLTEPQATRRTVEITPAAVSTHLFPKGRNEVPRS